MRKTVFFYAIALLASVTTHAMNPMPEIKTIDISRFGGRVLEESQIRPGTFTIAASFPNALGWGKDAILRYSKTKVEIWKPDIYTMGTFQYAVLPAPNGYNWNLEIKNNVIILHPEKDWHFFIFFPVMYFLIATILAVINTTEKKAT